jgi:hypothetical protein
LLCAILITLVDERLPAREHNVKGTSLAQHAFDPEHPSMLRHYRLTERQAQPQAIDLARETGIDSVKAAKNG